jgi:hypothetical protein|tara:strand:+ start:224 stop:883 length:660 start_codon:yes stop_codon:yes gene_type:complete
MQNETMEVIRNFGTINQNLVFKQGNVLRTVADAKNVLAKAVLDEEFPQDFGIYDVGEFMNVFNLIEDGTVAYEDKHMHIANTKASINYFYSDIEMLTNPPEKDLAMPDAEVTFTLTQEILGQLRKAAAALGHKSIHIKESDDGLVALSIADTQNSTSNDFTLSVEGTFNQTGNSVPLSINIDNLKLLPGDYEVEVSSKLISKFVHTDKNLTYWIALEKK